MTEFEYDCYQKKSVARSASRRKCGSKSKKCNLSTDHMTEKEWNERCGDVMSYNLNKPLTWKEFVKLPNDLREEYMNNLIEEYSANARGMADMFGVSVATVFRMVKNENLNVKFLKGRYPSGAKEEAFKRFLNGEAAEPVEDSGLEDTECDSEKTASLTCDKPDQNNFSDMSKTRLDSFTMNFSGEINVDMIANSIRYILGSGGRAKIQVVCELN